MWRRMPFRVVYLDFTWSFGVGFCSALEFSGVVEFIIPFKAVLFDFVQIAELDSTRVKWE